MVGKVPDFEGDLRSFRKSVNDAKVIGRAFRASLRVSVARLTKAKPRKASPQKKRVRGKNAL
jgi:hypothetical protein